MTVRYFTDVTINDLSDAYNVVLMPQSAVFTADTTKWTSGAVSITAMATCGSAQVDCNVPNSGDYLITAVDNTGANALSKLSVSVAKAAGTQTPVVTITGTSNMTVALAPYTVTIPVTVAQGQNTIEYPMQVEIALAKTGTAATSPYNAVVGLQSVSIACDKDGDTSSAQSIVIPFAGYQGTSRKSAAATVTTSSLPSGVTVGTNTAATTSADGSLTLNVASGSGLGGNDSGEIAFTVKVDGKSTAVFPFRLAWSKSKTGATGQKGDTGSAGESATSVVCGNEAVSIPCTLGGLVSAKQTITIPFAGYVGTARSACTVAASGLPTGMTVKTNTAATDSADGSLVIEAAKDSGLGGATTYTGEFTLTFTCNSKSFVKKFTWSKAMTGATGAQGPQGEPGEDPHTISVAYSDSNGNTIRNHSGSVTMTANVFCAGAQLDAAGIAEAGQVRWYAVSSGATTLVTGSETGLTLSQDGLSLTVDASYVTNSATFRVQLEG